MKKTLSFVLALALAAVSCKKKEKETGDFNFYNLKNEPVTIDIYATQNDYANRTNAIRHLTVTHDQSNYVNLGLNDSTIYYIDYHNNDYSNSNWLQLTPHNGSSFNSANSFRFAKGGDFWLYDFRYPVAQVLLPGHETKWKAIDAYGFNQGGGEIRLWDSLSANGKFVTLKCASDAFIVNYKKTDGSLITDSVSPGWIGAPANGGCSDISVFHLDFEKLNYYSIFNIGKSAGSWGHGAPIGNIYQESRSASVDTIYLMIGQQGYIMTKE